MSYSPVLNPHPVAQSGAWNVNISNASIPVTGAFWQATQPVSASALPLPAGAATSAKQPALGTAGVAATDVLTVQGIASGVAQPVSGTFWQATQPVSGTITANAGTGTFAISAASLPLPAGASTAAKQPALGTAGVAATDVLTVQGIASGVAQPVSGTFWQATQPVSFTQQALPANQSVNAAQINGITPLMGNGVTGTGSLRVTIASDNSAFSVNATPPTLTKGTQGSTGLSVQELKDGGRSCLAMTAEFTFAQVAETLLTMTLSVDGAATSTFTSRLITSGKKFRIQSIDIEVESLGSGTAPQRAYLRLRRNTAGATTASSALQAVWSCINSSAIVKSGAVMHADVPDALEMNGDGTATFGFTLETPDWVTTTATGRAKITVIGFEF